MRSLLVEIYPPNLYDEGLEAVLSDLLARLEPRGIEGTLVVEAPLERLDLDRTQLMYRVAQEGLRNVMAHAEATRVIGVDHVGPVDDLARGRRRRPRGRGSAKCPTDRDISDFERSPAWRASLGARLTVWSTPGKGTVLALEVPIT